MLIGVPKEIKVRNPVLACANPVAELTARGHRALLKRVPVRHRGL